MSSKVRVVRCDCDVNILMITFFFNMNLKGWEYVDKLAIFYFFRHHVAETSVCR